MARKKRGAAVVEVDLHGMTVEQAQRAVDSAIARLPRGQEIKLRVITGKGIHSGPEGGVLGRDIHYHVATRYRSAIVRLDESPADVRLGGVPIRGHFDVTLRL